MKISLIMAAAPDGLIGADNRLPWRLPSDLKRFRRLTLGKPIVMGRKTFESLGKPLDGRRNIVLSRRSDHRVEGGEVVPSLDAAIARVGSAGGAELMVIGGSAVFHEALPLAQQVYLTLVEGRFEGDVYFPIEILRSPEWVVRSEEFCPADDRNPYPHRFSIIERVVARPS